MLAVLFAVFTVMTLRVMMHDPMHERSLAVSLFVLLFPCKIEKYFHDNFRTGMFTPCDYDCDFSYHN